MDHATALFFLFLLPHRTFRLPLGDWHVVGMGQVFPVVTTGGPDNGDGGELRRRERYLTQAGPGPAHALGPISPYHCPTLWGESDRMASKIPTESVVLRVNRRLVVTAREAAHRTA